MIRGRGRNHAEGVFSLGAEKSMAIPDRGKVFSGGKKRNNKPKEFAQIGAYQEGRERTFSLGHGGKLRGGGEGNPPHEGFRAAKMGRSSGPTQGP